MADRIITCACPTCGYKFVVTKSRLGECHSCPSCNSFVSIQSVEKRPIPARQARQSGIAKTLAIVGVILAGGAMICVLIALFSPVLFPGAVKRAETPPNNEPPIKEPPNKKAGIKAARDRHTTAVDALAAAHKNLYAIAKTSSGSDDHKAAMKARDDAQVELRFAKIALDIADGTASRPRVTRENYNKIRINQSDIDEVESILGAGKETSRYGRTINMVWTGQNGETISIQFEVFDSRRDGIIVRSKSMFGD